MSYFKWFTQVIIYYKYIINLFFFIIYRRLNQNENQSEEQKRKKVTKYSRWCSGLFLWVGGMIIREKKVEYESVYKKYLGPDYKCDINDKNYSLLICNHIGFYEVLFSILRFAPGFIAKLAIQSYYFIGNCAIGLKCLFVDRSSPEARHKIVRKIYINIY